MGLMLGRLRGAKLVFWVMDVYPQIAIQLGTIRGGSLVGAGLERLSTKVLREADAVVALDEAMEIVWSWTVRQLHASR